ncbi:hypothetical protein [Brevundimonas sanguinis]|uniref:hypothetical protein n=1 Tax=Brevundimonas sanguinis TaxID=3021811 RepID=UPI002415380A|nr:hypothetical protein [Brevundimonas sp. NCCP 15609]
MFRARTVFVIGAGASCEVGLPVGDSLLKAIVDLTHFEFDIGRLMKGDRNIFDALKIFLDEGGDVSRLKAHLMAGRQLGKSAKQALSIDNVIDALENSEIEILGKLGIARAILKAEAESPYFKINFDTNAIDVSKFKNTWYSSLTQLLTEQVKRSEIDKLFDNVEVVNFNYDRCLEYYLQYSLSDYCGVGLDIVRNSMSKLTVHRPYGLVGRLPWRPGDGPGVEFGQGAPQQLAQIVPEIRTFTEQVEEGDNLNAIRSAIAKADRIVFLGFAFHRQNVALISTEISDHAQILATAMGISSSDRDVIEDELAEAFGFAWDRLASSRVSLAVATCHELFKDYWRTLTAAAPE